MKTTCTQILIATTLIGVLAAIVVPVNVIAQDPNVRNKDAASEEEWAYSVGVQNLRVRTSAHDLRAGTKAWLDPVALEKAKKFAPAAHRSINSAT